MEKENKETENKISLEELILKQLDWSLEMKSRLEAKAVGYLAFITLILTILSDFLKDVYPSNICSLFKWTCIGFFIATFIVGLILLVLCAKMLLPKNIEYFSCKKLMDLHYETKNSDNSDNDDYILSENEKFIEKNEKTIARLDSYNKSIAFGLIYMIIGFIISSILFFVFIGGEK